MNPWTEVPASAPFVLESDRDVVLAFNRLLKKYSDQWIHTGRLPEPRQGPVDAPVVLLQLNPSYDEETKDQDLDKQQVEEGRAALADESSKHRDLARPNSWWDDAFGTLILEFGRERLAERVCSIEYFAYPSLKFNHGELDLPSHNYQSDLVLRAIRRGAIFIVSKGLTSWISKVPELAEIKGKSLFQTKNRQRVWITPGNLPDGAFDVIRSVL